MPQDGAAPQDAGIPKHLEWYRDSTKWLVTIAGGAVLLGLGFFEDRLVTDLLKIVFSVAAAFLLLACASGILCIFKIADHARDLQSNIDAQPPGAAPPATDTAALAGARLLFKTCFYLSIGGAIALIVFVGVLLWVNSEQPKTAAGHRFVIVPLSQGQGSSFVVIDHTADRAYTIIVGSDGRASLKPAP